jgi:hypothetical protein
MHIAKRACGALAFASVLVMPAIILAQANVPGIRGEWGLKSGSQMPPGAFLGFIYDWYHPDRIIDRDGVSIDRVSLDQQAFGLFPMYVSPKPIFGNAHWGMFASIPWANASIDVANADVTTGWGFSDINVQPIYLGWNLSRADVTTGFSVTMPTGRFTEGARDNTGLGMWSFAFDLGSTVYFGTTKQWNVATLATFQTQSDVKDTDKRAGNALSLEGGAGYSFFGGMGTLGAAYYAQWKVSDDRNFPILRIPRFDSRSRYFALGPELTTPLSNRGGLLVLLTARYFFEMGNRVATEGDQLIVFVTLGVPFLPGQ